MKSENRVMGAITEIAAEQWGLITTAQGAARDISRLQLSRLADDGVLRRVAHGIYALAGSDDSLEDLYSAWVSCAANLLPYQRTFGPDDAVVSYTSAASLHQVGDFYSEHPHLTVPKTRRSRRDIVFHTAVLPPEDITVLRGLPVTSPERTIADLIRARHDTGHVASILAEFSSRGTFNREILVERLDPLAKRNGHESGEAFVFALEKTAGIDAESLQIKAASDLVAAYIKGSSASHFGQTIAEFTGRPLIDPTKLTQPAFDIAKLFESAVALRKADFNFSLTDPSLREALSPLANAVRNFAATVPLESLVAMQGPQRVFPPALSGIQNEKEQQTEPVGQIQEVMEEEPEE